MKDALYTNAKAGVASRAADLLQQLSLAEKVSQLRNLVTVHHDFYRLDGDAVVVGEELLRHLRGDRAVGMVQCLTRCDFWTGRTPADGFNRRIAARVANTVQQAAIAGNRWGIPLLLFDDCRHGVPGIDTTVFPCGVAQASAWDDRLQTEIGRVIGRQMRSVGIHVSIGPNLNLARDPRWSRMEETYGEDPFLAGKLGCALIRGLQQPGTDGALTAAAAMHFVAAMGDAENGLDARTARIGRGTLAEVFRPFGMAAAAGVRAAMASYTSIDGVPCHANAELLTEMLRNRYGFTGVIESDANGVMGLSTEHRLSADPVECVAAALNAGLTTDLFMFGDDWYTLDNIARALDRKLVNLATVDKLVFDVLCLKIELGLFENPYVAEETAEIAAADGEIALESARRSITLLHNPNGLLPLDRRQCKRIAVIGPQADDVYNMLGDYTPFVDREKVVTVLDGLHRVAPECEFTFAPGCRIKKPIPGMLARAAHLAEEADCIVLALGGSSNRYGQEFNAFGGGSGGAAGDADCGEGYDRADLTLPLPQLQLYRRLRRLGKPLIVLLLHGRPIAVPEIAAGADAVLDLWYPGEAGGQAAAEAIFGVINPSGRLPISIPRHSGQLPVYYNTPRPGRRDYVDMTAAPLWEFGFGLSYTTFAYEALRLSATEIRATESVEVSVQVRNTGDRAGAEVVQFYLTDEYSSRVRPVRELCGFRRIELAPGETGTVRVTLTGDELGFFDANGKLKIEAGDFQIGVGGSQHPALTAKLTVTSGK